MADEIRLIDIVEEFISGDWGEENATDDAPCAVSCVRGADIVPISNSRFENIPVRYISASSLKNRGLSEGDIIIEKSGGSPTQSTGRTVYVSKKLVEAKKNIVCSNFCQAFRLKVGWNPLYVYYYLQVVYNSGVFFNFEGKTSGLKNLILDSAFQSITIKKVPLQEQDRIANMLSLIDDKIAANHAINDYLEAMARQLYDYWFVQFDFPNEKGRPYKSSGGKMVWNDNLKRMIPENWINDNLGNVIDLFDFKRVPLSSIQRATMKGEYPYYGATGIMDYINDYIFDGEYVLLAEDGSTSAPDGSPIVQFVWGRIWVNNHAHIILPKERTNIHYTFLQLKSIPAKMMETGSIQKKISQENMLKQRVVVPPKSVVAAFERIISPIWADKKNAIEQIDHLLKQRDELLPLLMNGQVSVKQLNNHLSAV